MTLSEIKSALEDDECVEGVEYDLSLDDGSRYLVCKGSPAGPRLHDLHDEFDFEIRSAYHDPVHDCLRLAIWPRE